MRTIGIIGTGNMGSALATAISKNSDVELILANRTRKKAEILAEKTGARVVSNCEAAKADFVLLGVEPDQVQPVLDEIKPFLNSCSVLISMVAGCSISKLKEYSGGSPVIRIMPNTPVSIGEGMTLCTASSDVKADDMLFFERIMKTSGTSFFG